MPNIKSQIKRVKTNQKENARNKAVKSNLRSTVKKAETAISAGVDNKEAVRDNVYSVVDKAVHKGVIHKNTANRRKSAIAKKANA